jgi:LmbE family N-acetylglucosaminyl deacetylase
MDWKLIDNKKPRALILHAHPDDETIFAGGLILSNPNWSWTMVCLTMQPARLESYKNAMKSYLEYGVDVERYLTLNKEDTGQDLSDSDKLNWLDAVKNLNLNPDIVITHNSAGEYGHNHHIATNHIAHELYDNVWDFIFPGENVKQEEKELINRVALGAKIREKKRQILETHYESESTGLWENLKDVMVYEFEKGPELFTTE